ncbi:MAG: CRTAC1 family protein, partial [Psychrosphaera sp.]|nr:CRTAC1 family protein [Psychrosphaera sp.]
DGDGDLFVAHCQKYIYDPSSPTHPTPVGLEPTPVQLFRNDGNLKFTDVTEASGLSQFKGNWMSVSFADMDHDGNIDFFSTNAGFTSLADVESGIASAPHGLFRNKGDGTFENIAEQAGVAHYELSWGSSFTDFDNDGYADLFFIGSLPIPPAFLSGPMANPGRLFMNDNAKHRKSNTFSQNVEDGDSIGLNLAHEYTSGVAYGDFNNDGFQDLTIIRELWSPQAESGKPVLLKNKGNSNRWVGVQLQGTDSNKWGVGAKVMIKSGKMCQFQEIYAGSNFASTDSHRLNFGLGKHRRISKVLVTWPGGKYELFTKGIAKTNRIHHLVEGTGRKVSARKVERMMRRCK